MTEKQIAFDPNDALEYTGKRRHWMTHSGSLYHPSDGKISEVKIKLSKDEADISYEKNREIKHKIRIHKDNDHWDIKENDEKLYSAHKKRGRQPGVVLEKIQDDKEILIIYAIGGNKYSVFKYEQEDDEKIDVKNIDFDKFAQDPQNAIAVFDSVLGRDFKIRVNKSFNLKDDTLSILSFFFLVMNRARPRGGNAGPILAGSAVVATIPATTV